MMIQRRVFSATSEYILIGFTLVMTLVFGVLTVYSHVVFAGTIAAIIWLILVRLPSLALAILFVGFYLYPIGTDIIGVGTSSVLTAGYYILVSTAAFLGTLRRWPKGLSGVFQRRENMYFLFFLAWMLLNWLLLSLSNGYAGTKMGIAPWLMVIPFLVPQFMDRLLVTHFLKASILVGAFGALLTGLTIITGTSTEMARLSVSENVSALGFSYSLGVSGLLAVAQGLYTNSIKAKVLSITFLIGVVAIFVAAGARGPIVALACGLFVLGIGSDRSSRIHLLLAIGAAVLAAILVLPSVSLTAQSRISAFFQADDTQTFAESRGYLWRYALTAWQTNPVSGIGVGNYLSFLQNANLREEVTFAHNFLLEILSELGLIGIVFFGLFFRSVLSHTISLMERYRKDVVVMSTIALLTFSLVKMSFSGQIQVSVEFWLACGLVLGLASFKQKCNQTYESMG